MITKKIIPCLDVDKGRVVKGKKFQDIQDVADPVELGKYYCDEGADELVFYDITASKENRRIFLDTMEKVAEHVDIPFTVGGGISSIEDFKSVIDAGANKVSINSAAVINPDLIREASEKFGKEAIVLSIDAKRNTKGSWDVYIKGGEETTNLDALDWAKQGENLGVGEICINSIDEDGVKEGYDILLNSKLSQLLNIPIIASGGAGKMIHFKDVLECGADAALAASVFHYKEIKIKDLKVYLHENGIPIRR